MNTKTTEDANDQKAAASHGKLDFTSSALTAKEQQIKNHTAKEKHEPDFDKISTSSFLDEKFDIGQEDEGITTRRTEVPAGLRQRANLVKVNQDLDIMSDMRLSKIFFKDGPFKDGDEQEMLFDGEPILGKK